MWKKLFLILIIFTNFQIAKSQETVIYQEVHNPWNYVSEWAVSLGAGVGDYNTAGIEGEWMFLPKISLQTGVGINGFSGGVNYHFYPIISSSYISFKLWQQGFSQNYKAFYAGSMLVYRANKYLQAGFGIGYALKSNTNIVLPSKYAIMFNLGIYLPYY